MIDKENIPISTRSISQKPLNTNNIAPSKYDSNSVPIKSISKKSSNKRGGFGRLLSEVTNEMKDADNIQYAAHLHNEEASQIAVEWVQEACDARMAKKMAKDVETELKEEKSQELKKNEAAALKIALEERSISKQKAENKKRIEKEDADFAKKTVLDDIDETINFENLCSKDSEYALEVEKLIKDELLAEDLMAKEKANYELHLKKVNEQSKADENIAAAIAADLKMMEAKLDEDKIAQSKADEQTARSIQEDFKKQDQMFRLKAEEKDFQIAKKAQMESIKSDMKNKLDAERADASYARKMSMKIERERHRSTKATSLKKSGKIFRTAAQVRQQWLEAEAEIEDVCRGICITLLLPFMRDLKVSVGDSQNVEIEARRLMAPDEKVEKDDEEDSSCYIAEFFIDGAKNKITDDCMSYEYASESGLLHVYVDNVHLERSMAEGSTEKEGVLSRFKKGFSRMFNRNKGGKGKEAK